MHPTRGTGRRCPQRTVGRDRQDRMRNPLMSAPALIALAHGSRDPRSARTVREIVATTKATASRPRIEPAFLDHVRPDLDAVVDRLVAKGHTEIVVVPLLLTDGLPRARRRAGGRHRPPPHRHQDMAIRVADVVGHGRRACWPCSTCGCVRRCGCPGSASSTRSCSPRLARPTRGRTPWSAGSPGCGDSRHHLPTSVAFASTAPPSTGEAVRDWRRQGRRHVAVGSLFIAPGKLPDRAEELALEAGAVAVSAPLGAHEELSRVILARYSVGALQLVAPAGLTSSAIELVEIPVVRRSSLSRSGSVVRQAQPARSVRSRRGGPSAPRRRSRRVGHCGSSAASCSSSRT